MSHFSEDVPNLHIVVVVYTSLKELHIALDKVGIDYTSLKKLYMALDQVEAIYYIIFTIIKTRAPLSKLTTCAPVWFRQSLLSLYFFIISIRGI